MDYYEYIKSPAWKVKRQERLAFDSHRCAICHTTENLSVHHLHYDTLGNEDAQHDLISLCPNHHHLFDGLERFRRYSLKKREVTIIESSVTIRQETQYGMVRSEVQIDISLPDANAQRADGGPNKQVVKVDQADFIQARQDRR